MLLDSVDRANGASQSALVDARSSTREAILASVRRLLRDRPLDALSMEGVAQAAGVSRRTVYNKFDNLDELFRSCCEQLVARLAADVPAQIPDNDNPETGLLQFGADAARLFADDRYTDLMRELMRAGSLHKWLEDACWRHIRAPMILAVEVHLLRHRRLAGRQEARRVAGSFLSIIESLAVWSTFFDDGEAGVPSLDPWEIATLACERVAAGRRRAG